MFRSSLFWVMLLAVIALGQDYIRNGTPQIGADTASYVRVSKHLGEVLCGDIDVQRTPVYPAFLALCRLIAGEPHYQQCAVLLQYIVSLFSVFVFYRLGQILFRSDLCSVSACAVYIGGFICLDEGYYHHHLLTESLSVSATVFFFYGLVSCFVRPAYWKSIFTGLGLFLLVMLRPAFSVFVPIMFLFWFAEILFLRSDLKKHLMGLAATTVTFIAVLGYSQLVYQKCGVFSPTLISAYNQFYCVIQAGLYETGSDPVMNEKIRKIIGEWKEQHPDKLADPNWLLTAVYFDKESPLYNVLLLVLSTERLQDGIHLTPADKESIEQISSYTAQTIKEHKFAYLKYVIQKILVFACEKQWLMAWCTFLLSGLVWLAFLPKMPAKQNLIHLFCLLLAVSIIFTAFAFAQTDYGRLSAPIISLLILSLFLIFDRLLLLRKQKTSACPSGGLQIAEIAVK